MDRIAAECNSQGIWPRQGLDLVQRDVAKIRRHVRELFVIEKYLDSIFANLDTCLLHGSGLEPSVSILSAARVMKHVIASDPSDADDDFVIKVAGKLPFADRADQ